MSVNELLVLQKAVRERVNQLKNLVRESSVQTSYYGEKEKVVTPQYDGKLIDKKVTELEMWLFKSDAAIKQSNAVTQVNVEADVDKLLSPIE